MPVYYWGRDEGKSEVDFVVQWRNEIVPVEVKSGIRTQSKSLDIYRGLYHPAHSVRAALKGFGVNGGLYAIPLYMIASFADILAGGNEKEH
jgi:predicted AAA+ superfamily ATPase